MQMTPADHLFAPPALGSGKGYFFEFLFVNINRQSYTHKITCKCLG